MAVAGNVIRVTVIGSENLLDVNVTSFLIGGKPKAGFVILPSTGAPPCRVWNIGYLVEEEDHGPLTFAVSYLDFLNRTGVASSDDTGLVHGRVTVSSFAEGAMYWRIRSLTIGKGGYVADYAWKITQLALYHKPDLAEQVQTTNAVMLTSSENAHACGFLESCQNLTTEVSQYLYADNEVGDDPELLRLSVLNYPSVGFGKRFKDSKSNRYVGTGNLTVCANACDSMPECRAFTFSSSSKKPGCYLHGALRQASKPSDSFQTTYYKLAPECPAGTMLACNDVCMSDRQCRNFTALERELQLPNTSAITNASAVGPIRSCQDMIGQGQCTEIQKQLWNCPLHGCNRDG